MSDITVYITGYEEMSDPSGVYIQFVVKVTKDGIEWEVRKRFSEFSFFYTGVSDYCSSLSTTFPSKKFGRLSAGQLEERREELEVWFTEFLERATSSMAVRNQLNAFLQVEAHSSGDNVLMDRSRIDIRARLPTGRIIKAGYLTKLGGNKQGGAGNWKRRYIVLQDDIAYYESEEAYLQGGVVKGVVKLNTYYVTIEEDGDFTFTIHALPFPLTCRADTEDEMMSWVEVLRQYPDMI